jgi:hypothetical protein
VDHAFERRFIWSGTRDPHTRIGSDPEDLRQRLDESMVSLIALEPPNGGDDGSASGVVRRLEAIPRESDADRNEYKAVPRNAEGICVEVDLELRGGNETVSPCQQRPQQSPLWPAKQATQPR